METTSVDSSSGKFAQMGEERGHEMVKEESRVKEEDCEMRKWDLLHQ